MIFPKNIADIKCKALVDGEVKEISLYDYKGKYVVLAFYPLDFTYVCPTEINKFSDYLEDFKKKNAVVLLISCDSTFVHERWACTPRDENGIQGVAWPMIWDAKRELSTQFGLFDEENGHPMRGTVILSKDTEVKHLSANDAAIGRSVSEILRLIDAITFSEKYGEICPVDWVKND